MPPFQVSSLMCDILSSASFKDKVTFIYYWGPGCIGCELARPGLNKLIKKYENQMGVEFIAISACNKDLLLNYLDINPLYFPIYLSNEQLVHGW